MAQPNLQIQDLQVAIDGNTIIQGLNLTIQGGEVHAIMGPNGTGKSTLTQALMGHPRYEVTGGSVTLDGQDLLAMKVDERARAGMFLAMQYPSEIPGVSNANFIRLAVNARQGAGKELPVLKFHRELQTKMQELSMDASFADRYLNEGFSGGEKKRNEILQMTMLKPRIAILDEIDSGLDIDALKVVAQAVNDMRGPEMGVLIITHYQRLLQYIEPDVVHVLVHGRIVRSGGKELAVQLEQQGYDWLKDAASGETRVQEAEQVTEQSTMLEMEQATEVVSHLIGDASANSETATLGHAEQGEDSIAKDLIPTDAISPADTTDGSPIHHTPPEGSVPS